MLVAGNWKMNPPSKADAVALAHRVVEATPTHAAVDVVVCPPTIWLDAVGSALAGSAIAVGAQTMHWADAGAFTGEASPSMVAELATHVILGHSERRQYDNETDEKVARKVVAALDHGLVPIVAVGETLDEREAGEAASVVGRQLVAAMSEVASLDGRALAVAYEPVWAIGTGVAASPADAQAGGTLIRSILRERFGARADEVPVLYGGSVTAANAAELFALPDVDGALVGGASLKPDDFAEIVRAAGASVR
jgi:triosephosphate isomerase